MADLCMRVCDFMSRQIVTVEASEHLDIAADIMRLGRVRHLPVMSRGRVAGIVTQRDLLHASSSSGLALRPEAAHDWMAHVPVADVMSRDAVSTDPGTSVRSAVEIMLLKKIGCLPVIDEGKLIGLLGETDSLRLLTALLASRDDSAARSRDSGV